MEIQQLFLRFITVTFLMMGHESVLVTDWEEMDCAIQIFRRHYCRGDPAFSWRIKDEEIKGRRIWPSFIPKSLRTTGHCQWVLCSAKREGKIKCNRIQGNTTFTHQTDWKWTNHRLTWVRKAKKQQNKDSNASKLIALPLQSSGPENEVKVTLKNQNVQNHTEIEESRSNRENVQNMVEEIDEEKEDNSVESSTESVQDIDSNPTVDTELPEEDSYTSVSPIAEVPETTVLPEITTFLSQMIDEKTVPVNTQLPDEMPDIFNETEVFETTDLPESIVSFTPSEIESKPLLEETTEGQQSPKAPKMTHEENVKSKEKIAVATVLREEEEGARGAKAEKKMSAVLQQNSDKEQKILQASRLAIPQQPPKEQQQSNEIPNPENSLKNNEIFGGEKKGNLKEDKSETGRRPQRPLSTVVVIEKEFFNATDALQEEKDVTIEEARIGVAAASEAIEAGKEGNTKKVVKESGGKILHAAEEDEEFEAAEENGSSAAEKQFNYAETKGKSQRRMFQGWRYRFQTILRTLQEEARQKKRIQERKDFEQQGQKKSTSPKLLPTQAATSPRPSAPAAAARNQQEATDEVERGPIQTLTLPFTTKDIPGSKRGFPGDSPEKPISSENGEILIICLGIVSGLMAFLTVFSAFKYQFLKSWPLEKKKAEGRTVESQASFYGVKFEALKQHDMTTDGHEEDDKTASLVCK